MRRALATALAVALWPALFSGLAQADEDYAAQSTAWNGLSELVELAHEGGCELRAPAALDWSALDGHDVLWLVYPRTPIDARKLERFLAGGGRAVIADDFGAARSALAALGLSRSPERPEVGAPDRFQHNPNLPAAHPRLLTALGRSTDRLIANHPASFQTAIPATFEFAPGEALVVEGRVGEGGFVALADPSLLINNMLELDEDRAFARALVAQTCRAGRDRILLLSGTFVARGDPPAVAAAPDAASPFARFNDNMHGVNGWLDGAVGRAPLWVFACLFALAGLAVLQGAFPARAQLADRFTRLERPHAESELGGVPWDYALPAAILREEVLARTTAALGEPPASIAFDAIGPQALARRIGDRFGAEAGRVAGELWRLLHRVRWHEEAGEAVPSRRVARGELLRLHELAVALFERFENREPPGEVERS